LIIRLLSHADRTVRRPAGSGSAQPAATDATGPDWHDRHPPDNRIVRNPGIDQDRRMLRGTKIELRARQESDLAVLHAELYDDVEMHSRAGTRP
jgi:hypothetical protein